MVSRKKAEKWIVWLGCCLGSVLMIFGAVYIKGSLLQQGIAREIIRFHVLADSDSDKDQQIKLKVKDRVVAYMQEKLTTAQNKEQAEYIIRNNLENR